MLADQLKYTASSTEPKRGADIFIGTSYPTCWEDYIGQESAKVQLQAACFSARSRKAVLSHVLIATGAHGVGKTALARLIAAELGSGFVEVQGMLAEKDGIRILRTMEDGDVLLWDEFHLAIVGGKSKAEWLLSYLQDGVIVSKTGVVQVPKVTIIAATTDAQKLPETIISRFKIQPAIEPYTLFEGAQIAMVKVRGGIFDVGQLTLPSMTTCVEVARAANCNPRDIDTLLCTLRDAAISKHTTTDAEGNYNLDKTLEWVGRTEDGLDRLAQDFMCVLLAQFGGEAGEKTIANALGEPTPPRHTEKLLIQKGYVSITAKGRMLTEAGIKRTVELLRARNLIEESAA